MTPSELKDLISDCVQALSDNRTGTGDYPVSFIYGRVSDMFLDNLKDNYVKDLEKGGVVFMEYAPFRDNEVNESDGWMEYGVIMHFIKSHKADARADANLLLQTEMYNLSVDFINVLKGNVTTNLSAANVTTLGTITAKRNNFSLFDYSPNLTAGVRTTLTVTTKFCSQ